MQNPDGVCMAVNSSPDMMTSISSRRSLSSAARFTFILYGILLTTLAASTSFLAVLVLPIVLLPTICFFRYHSSMTHARQADIERLCWTYLGATIPGIPLVMLVQGAMMVPFVSMALGSRNDFFWHELQNVKKESHVRDNAHRAERAELAASSGHWAVVVFMSFIVAAGTEEMLKYVMVMLARKGSRVVHEMDSVMNGAAAGLGFAITESLGFIFTDCQGESSGKLLLTIVERIGLSIPLHVICGMLTGVNAARLDLKQERLNLLKIFGPAIFFHGLFDLVLLGYSAWMGHIGWVHPEDARGIVLLLISNMVVMGGAILAFRRSMARVDVKKQ